MKYLVLFPFLLMSIFLKAQEDQIPFKAQQPPIPVEVMVGTKSGMYQMTINKRFTADSKFKFFNLVNYEVDYEDQTPNKYIVQTIASYEFIKGFDVGAGANLSAFGGFRPVVSTSYTRFTRAMGIIINPVYEIHKDGEFSVLARFEWHPVNDKKIQPYFSVQALTSWKDVHSFSYHNWRAGIQYKIFSFGPAVNFEYVGKNAEGTVNCGGFVNILIH
jgi:hypothetical protein